MEITERLHQSPVVNPSACPVKRGQVHQYNLGIMYGKGNGVQQDYAEAVKWYRLATEQGNAYAQYNLGVMYDNGIDVPQDYAEAVKWYRLAAEQGNANSQHNMGVLYGNGNGVPQDYIQGHMWFNLAAAKGSQIGRDNRDVIAKLMTPAQIAKAQALARKWLEEHGE